MSRAQLSRSLKQLTVVLRLETDKENSALQAFKTAQDHSNEQQQKLRNLQQYRLDYLRQIQQQGNTGVSALQYQQHLSFVGKLDKACEQQNTLIAQCNVVVQQRRDQWLAQQQRRKAVEKLMEKSQHSLGTLDARMEQQQMDEYSQRRLGRRLA